MILYHVTFTKHVSSIRRLGIRPCKPWQANWVEAGSGNCYGEGDVFAFESAHDAIRWAAKMDWEFHKQTGSGSVSVVKFDGSGNTWTRDDADPIAQAGSEGRWLRTAEPVRPEAIRSVRRVTRDLIMKTLRP